MKYGIPSLLSTNKIPNGKLYQVLNLLAAIFMAIGVFPKNAWFSFILQIIWALIAIIAIFKIIKQEKENKTSKIKTRVLNNRILVFIFILKL